jgi:surface carbohydrate biosynthesis protein (TIGR04326 family)
MDSIRFGCDHPLLSNLGRNRVPASAKANDINQTLLIWDAAIPAPADAKGMVFWRSYEVSSNATSIPLLVEGNAERLRGRYLAWVHELGKSIAGNARVVDHLALRPGFSYWWMTQIAEKCNFEKSPHIDDAIRFMAFDDWAQGQQIDRVDLATSNHALAECMRIWCAKRAIFFKLLRLQALKTKSSSLKRIYGVLPQALQALIWLIHYLWVRWPLRGVGLKAWRSSPGRVTFVSYLFNLVPEATAQGRFESRYWGPLPELLQKDVSATNWLHIYVKDALLPTAKKAADLLRSFNQTSKGAQHHVALDTFLGPRVIMHTLRDWGRLMRAAIRLRKWLPAQQHPDSHLWPLVEQDWRKSIFGVPALNNLLFFNLLEAALDVLPQQDRGVYLQENQGWEFGLVHAWTAAGHGRMIGCPHSSVRFWDLRYFFDPRSYQRTGKSDLPMPHQVACNGPAMRQALEAAGYPLQDLVDVEALRYLQLAGLGTGPSLTAEPLWKGLRVLVLGDYRKENTHRQLQLLEQALPLLRHDITLLVKSHPACPIHAEDYPGLVMQFSMQPITELVSECDVAYSSAVTSGAVDAYCCGLPTVVVLDPNTLDLSPLRGCAGAFFASTPEELAAVLASAGPGRGSAGGRTEFFTLDSQVPRWRALFQNTVALNRDEITKRFC